MAETQLGSHIILCGLGQLGCHVLELLLRLGERVAVITTQQPSAWPPPNGVDCLLLLGDAREERLLRQAGIADAKGVIVTTSDDLVNVSIALDARRLNAKIPVVTRLFDQDLGAHLEKDAGIRRVLSTSALAAPAFVGAALGKTTRGAFETPQGTCVLTDHTVERNSAEIGKSLEDWSVARGCSAIGMHRGGAWMVEGLDSVALQAGDVLAGLRVEPHRDTDPIKASAGLGASKWGAFEHGLREWWGDVPRVLQVALGVLGLVVLVSVILFHWFLKLPVVDALYFVVTIITTVGFGDYNFQNASPWLKLYGAVLMLCGAALLAMLFSMITDLVLSIRLRDVMTRGCARLKNHVIVVGLGNIGFRVLREVARNGYTVVAIERDGGGKFVESARSLACVVLGNGRAEETMHKAGLAGAKAILALTDDDIANLSIGLAAKRARPEVLSVLRVFDANLARNVRANLAVDAVLSVSGEAAATFVGAVLGPGVLHGFVLGDFLVVIHSQGGASEPVQADRVRNELRLRTNGIGARWYRLRKEA